MKKSEEKFIDLSDIKENDLDKTSSFVDLMTKKERKKRELEKEIKNDDLEEMISEKKKNTANLTNELEKAKEKYNKNFEKELETENKRQEENEEKIGKTQILELTRQMKFNFEETKEENSKKNGVSPLNIIGEINLLCIGYYIYLLVFTDYQENPNNYLINGGIIVLLVLLFGMSVVTNKKTSIVFNVLNVIIILIFIVFNIITFIY